MFYLQRIGILIGKPYENSELYVFHNMKFVGEMFGNRPNYFFWNKYIQNS